MVPILMPCADEYRRKVREILEARERTDEYAAIVAEHKGEAK
jgi:hypothetical protein